MSPDDPFEYYFWPRYPNRHEDDKEAARRAYDARIAEGVPEGELLMAGKSYIMHEQRTNHFRYSMPPQKFLDGTKRHWKKYVPDYGSKTPVYGAGGTFMGFVEPPEPISAPWKPPRAPSEPVEPLTREEILRKWS